VRAHERLGNVERLRENARILGVADVSEHHGGVTLEPRSFARFMGEFLNAAENSSCVISSSSRAS